MGIEGVGLGDLAVAEADGRAVALLDDDGALLGLDGGALGGDDHQHGVGLLLDVVHDLAQVVLDQVVEVLLLLGLGLELLRHQEDLVVDVVVLVSAGLDLGVQVGDFLADVLVHRPPDPPHLVLVDLLDVPDALQHVGDVVDAPLLHAQLARGLVDVQHEVVLALYQPDEPLRQQRQRVLPLPALLPLLPLPLLPRRLLLPLPARLARRTRPRLEDHRALALPLLPLPRRHLHLHLLTAPRHYKQHQLIPPAFKRRPTHHPHINHKPPFFAHTIREQVNPR